MTLKESNELMKKIDKIRKQKRHVGHPCKGKEYNFFGPLHSLCKLNQNTWLYHMRLF
jgi:hypothetical protein